MVTRPPEQTPVHTELIDWLSVTIPVGVELDYPQELSSVSVDTRAFNNYTAARRYSDGRIEMINPDRPDMGVHVIFSGAAMAECRAAGLSDMDIVGWAVKRGKVSRIDIAVDVYNTVVDFDKLEGDITNKNMVTVARKAWRTKSIGEAGDTIYIGTKGKTQMCIYDKAALNKSDGTWTRIEMRYRSKKAHPAARKFVSDGKYKPLLKGFADFPSVQWWNEVMQGEAEKIKADSPDSDTWRWLIKSAAPSLAREYLDRPERLHDFIAHVIEIAKEVANNGSNTRDDTTASA